MRYMGGTRRQNTWKPVPHGLSDPSTVLNEFDGLFALSWDGAYALRDSFFPHSLV